MRPSRAVNWRSAWRGLLGAGAVCGLLWVVAGLPALAQTPSVSPVQRASEPIPLPEVAAQAEQARRLLADLEARSVPDGGLRTIESGLSALSDRLRSLRDRADQQLKDNPPLAALEVMLKEWKLARLEPANQLARLTQAAAQADQDLQQASELRARWARTLEEARKSRAPGSVIRRIEETLAGIRSTQRTLEGYRATVLSIQERLTQQARLGDDMLERIERAKGERVGTLLQIDGLPVWHIELWTGGWSELPSGLAELAAGIGRVVSVGLIRAGRRAAVHLILFTLLLALIMWADRASRRWIAEKQPGVPSAAALERPVSAALLLWMFFSPALYSQESWTLVYLATIIAVVPAVRAAAQILPWRLGRGRYVFAAIVIADRIRELLTGVPSLEQIVFLGEMVAATLFGLWIFRRMPLPAREGGCPSLTIPAYLLRGVVALSAFAALIGGLGYMDLARIFGSGALVACFDGLAIFAGVHIVRGLACCLLRVWPLGLLESVRRHRAGLERRLASTLNGVGTLAWCLASLAAFTVLDEVQGVVWPLFSAEWGWGALRVALGDLILFGLVAWAALWVATAVRFVLEEDVFPRVQMAKGLPLALSRIAQYLIVLLGFSLALGVLGVDLTKITILAGAFGVGIGFGLQTIVNNFISGLVLLFERPVHVGDAVQIGEFAGEMRRIGFRSSTVRTWEGADVIVPNSQLISERVTNWTLSDRMRRIDIKVGVAYGTDPQRVLALLLGAARAHPKLLGAPEPLALFLGFGESALNFELRGWTEDFDSWVVIRSELGVAVYAALAEAQIVIPFPQRDIRVRTVEQRSDDKEAESRAGSKTKGEM
jgi:potassium-dependent mechanosensitive channel